MKKADKQRNQENHKSIPLTVSNSKKKKKVRKKEKNKSEFVCVSYSQFNLPSGLSSASQLVT